MITAVFLASGLTLVKLVDYPRAFTAVHDHTYAKPEVAMATELEDIKPNVEELNVNLVKRMVKARDSKKRLAVSSRKLVTRSSKLLSDDDLKPFHINYAPRIRLKKVDNLKRICSSVNLSAIDVYTSDKVSLSFRTPADVTKKVKQVTSAGKKEKKKRSASDMIKVLKVKLKRPLRKCQTRSSCRSLRSHHRF